MKVKHYFLRFATYFLLIGIIGNAHIALAGDVKLGEEKAQSCVQCHGAQGNAPIANYPKLAAQREKYLLYALKSYKDGSRNNAIMSAQVSNLTDDDLANLAAYFAAQSGDLY